MLPAHFSLQSMLEAARLFSVANETTAGSMITVLMSSMSNDNGCLGRENLYFRCPSHISVTVSG